jgi:hypothetical protein
MSLTELFNDFADLETFAAKLKRDPRTVRRWLNRIDGLPYISVGDRILIHVPSAREWLLGRMKRPNPRRPKQPQPQSPQEAAQQRES